MTTQDRPDRTSELREVRQISHVWIPMSDGVRLAARIWLPDDAESDPVPAILEYIPYRKNDGTAVRDSARQPELASYGYAAVRVDIRGSGDSEGLLLDEYLEQELEDACEVIAWLAEQPWCTGKVGMTGISWGGFNALQVAALRPPALAGIISVCSTDDRFADDVHYYGGCLVASDMLPWASTMLMAGARPPDPEVVGEGWREAWLERLEVRPFAEAWIEHQRRSEYWQHGSVSEDISALQCPVYMVGGWDDAYRDAVLRVLETSTAPRKGLIGPWGHVYPDQGVPGAPIDFIGESVRFWDHWLKGIDTGIMDEPMLRAFIRRTHEDPPRREERLGRWVSEPTWPSPAVEERRYTLQGASRLVAVETDGDHEVGGHDDAGQTIIGSQSAGIEAGAFMGSGVVEHLPGDQRREDGLSLAYTSIPLRERLTVLGQPEVDLDLAVDRPDALVAVRVCEVTPSGASRLLARGQLNLTHRYGHAKPEPMVPHERTTVTVKLNATGHVIEAGSRIRVAVSPTYWPWAWPSPRPVSLTVFSGENSRLRLPVRTSHEQEDPPSFVLHDVPQIDIPTRGGDRHVTHDWVTGRAELVAKGEKESIRQGGGLELVEWSEDRFSIVEGDPLSAEVECERTSEISRGDWRIRIETFSTMSSDAHNFLITNGIDAYECDTRVAAKRWVKQIPRDHL
jgi:uncharacterized protein